MALQSELSDAVSFSIYSSMEGLRKAEATRLFIKRAAYPDPGSEFGRALGIVKYALRIPMSELFFSSYFSEYLVSKGYDAVLMGIEGKLAGYSAFHVHDDSSMHIFSTWFEEEFRNSRAAFRLKDGVISHARDLGIERIKMGMGGNDFSQRMYEIISRRADRLGVVPEGDYWIRVLPHSPAERRT